MNVNSFMRLFSELSNFFESKAVNHEHFVGFFINNDISDRSTMTNSERMNSIRIVPKIGDSEEFGNGCVQITYFHEESVLQSWPDKISPEYPDEITYRTCAYILNFQCGVSLILCIFEDLIFSEDELLRIGIKYNFYDLESESRDPSSESHGYFSEMSEDVGDLEFYD